MSYSVRSILCCCCRGRKPRPVSSVRYKSENVRIKSNVANSTKDIEQTKIISSEDMNSNIMTKEGADVRLRETTTKLSLISTPTVVTAKIGSKSLVESKRSELSLSPNVKDTRSSSKKSPLSASRLDVQEHISMVSGQKDTTGKTEYKDYSNLSIPTPSMAEPKIKTPAQTQQVHADKEPKEAEMLFVASKEPISNQTGGIQEKYIPMSTTKKSSLIHQAVKKTTSTLPLVEPSPSVKIKGEKKSYVPGPMFTNQSTYSFSTMATSMKKVLNTRNKHKTLIKPPPEPLPLSPPTSITGEEDLKEDKSNQSRTFSEMLEPELDENSENNEYEEDQKLTNGMPEETIEKKKLVAKSNIEELSSKTEVKKEIKQMPQTGPKKVGSLKRLANIQLEKKTIDETAFTLKKEDTLKVKKTPSPSSMRERRPAEKVSTIKKEAKDDKNENDLLFRKIGRRTKTTEDLTQWSNKSAMTADDKSLMSTGPIDSTLSAADLSDRTSLGSLDEPSSGSIVEPPRKIGSEEKPIPIVRRSAKQTKALQKAAKFVLKTSKAVPKAIKDAKGKKSIKKTPQDVKLVTKGKKTPKASSQKMLKGTSMKTARDSKFKTTKISKEFKWERKTILFEDSTQTQPAKVKKKNTPGAKTPRSPINPKLIKLK